MPHSLNIPNNFICELTQLSAIRLEGEQAESYLQGQVTINVQRLDETNSLLACHCDFKGKLWNVGLLLKHRGGIEYLVQKSAQPTCLAELKKYGVFSKVEIGAVPPDERVFFGAAGDDAKSQLQSYFPSLSAEHHGTTHSELGWVITLLDRYTTKPRYLISLQRSSEAAQTLLTHSEQHDESLWHGLNIVNGWASIEEATSHEFVPQMLNMHLLNAIDFKKGCYMGQEVVARTKYLGKNKRATYLLRSQDTEAAHSKSVEAGDMLEKAVGDNWRRGGTVLQSALVDNQLWVLAVLSNDTQMGEELRFKAAPDLHLVVEPLPYSFDE
ncbi:tRNA-modifying protein YgfZ [Alteromonas oceanisediminis]|uniref:tRNA-modifying protein YgfZ n=1 Tax=Alteromonas oceanisediminis TaxID=2836180 RepID=UPI001BDA0BB7|nr:tRNA-modifying protein YgfZ [Alteromonas oceanisediminis]MBT0585791.1 tRNA-modifying protein YgfZ [Alteromonas oceanisediminis]